MATNAFNTATPTDPDTANVDDDLRKLKLDVGERLIQGGHIVTNITPPAPITNEPADGKHAIGWDTASPFATDAGTWTMVWDHAGTVPLVVVYGGSHATKAGQIEPQGSFKFMGPGITSGLDPGHRHTQGGVIGGKAGVISVTGYLKPSAFRWSKGAGEGTQTINKLVCRLSDPPTGGNFVVEFRKTSGAPAIGANVYDDAVASLVIGTVTILAGNYEAVQTTLANNVLADGEYIVQKVTTTTGSPANLVNIMEMDG